MNEKEAILNRLIEKSAEIITADEFKQRIESGDKLTHYIGFEISGHIHIGQGIMSALIMKDLTDLGVKCTIWLADWHTWINDKLDGTKETAAKIGEGYFTEAIKSCYKAVGGNPDDLEFRLASKWYEKDPMKFWETVMKVAQNTTDSRIKRSITIMGREAGDEIEVAKLLYPLMQVADVFYQDMDIAHAGTDQRKAYVIMRDTADKVAPNKPKPLVLLHNILPGLKSPDGKMSKSDPTSAIFIHDTPEEIEQKIKKAYAPEKDVENNPVLSWAENLIFWNRTEPVIIKRKEERGGNLEINDFANLKTAYENGSLHPMDLKSMVTDEIIKLLAPVRQHFEQPDAAAKKKELDELLAP